MENYMDLQVNADHEGDSKTHSPGPWTFELRDDHNTGENKWVIDSEDYGICTLDAPEEYNHANAKLIAAAPELLEALNEVAEFLGHIQPKVGEAAFNEIWDVVESAIKKATE